MQNPDLPNDDFRFKIEFHSSGAFDSIRDRIHEREFATELRERLGDHVIVSRDGNHLLLYMGNEIDARATHDSVASLVSQHGFDADVGGLERWHPIEEQWEDAAKALPGSGAEQ